MGCIKRDYQLETKSNVQPIKQAQRRIPIFLKPELKQKLDELCKNKITAIVTHRTDWISNLVLVKTPNKLRICLDPQNLNSALKRSEYSIPTIAEIMPSLNNAKVFSVVDTKDYFWNVKLSNDCIHLTTFWTPFSRYKFLRLPFGICTASEECQRRLHEVFEVLDGIEIIADDILIGKET
ncbi:hypothetical protein AVEN_154198-1 [Araneus ventricosus]|uniref:Reverse transcriptase domain-containing protein n=1 Tax=Araneus ventricosus TaxID=182803 RepID=A0A4Y2SET5_ARAVE|nr:hypothetical protein AVEN_74160-1 [Araneus ventricosus]GBN86774.1 hypothetical protein AVEN_154198-1 [Araneus ventricosus]